MKRLWAPWRIQYVQKKQKGCLFCRVKKSKRDSKNYIVKRSKYSFSILNIYPYNNGHIMIVPFRHVKDLEALRKEELLDMLELVKETKKDVSALLKPHGFNIGINIGKIAGAGFAHHIHVHLVPRWKGDANFMPIIADTKVISQSLEELYTRLKT
ncbi:HIT domain-containing protein [Candidatus Omnitrophota bacterium]